MSSNRFCDGVTRRDVLKIGVLGAGMFSGLGMNLANYLRLSEAGQVSGSRERAAIFIRLRGGPTHLDTFDLKPDAPSEYRGPMNPIHTNVIGMEISEQMPNLAKVADKFVILRGVSHTLAAHELGSVYMATGNRPVPSLEYPGYGSVVSKEISASADLPPYVAIPNTNIGGGYLGLQYGAFSTNNTPQLGKPFSVRGITLGNGLSVTDFDRRQNLLASMDTAFRGFESKIDVLEGLDEFSQRAYNMITSQKARNAFDIGQESADVTQRFGEHSAGASALLAARLVEAGVRFVTLNIGGWDHHQNIAEALKKNIPPLEQSLAALLTTLEERGLLATTSILMTGEFGRTPKINARAGRDHYPRAMFVFMAGGGMRGGQVIGASDDKGTGPAGDAITPEDVAASFYHSLGIDHQKEYHTNTGRPVMIVRNGNLIPGLFG